MTLAAEPPASAPAPQVESASPAAGAAPATAPTPAPTAFTEENALPLSPLVRKMARENNIDLNQIRGTGAGGRITSPSWW